jgi:phosphinothricin acetyltransferase
MPQARAIAIRPCFQQDLGAVHLIYHHHVMTALGTFETDPPDLEEITARWSRICARGWPYLVAVDAADPNWIHGFAYAQQFRDRPAYAGAFEDSVYVSPAIQGRGVGRLLLAHLLAELIDLKARVVIAVIGDSANEASIRAHAAVGFARVGIVPQAGVKFGRAVDIAIMQRQLEPQTGWTEPVTQVKNL